MVSLDIFFNCRQERGGEIAIFGEIIAVLEVDNGDMLGGGGGFGFLAELDEGVMGTGEVVVGNTRSGGAENTGDFEGVGEETSETQGRITGRVLLVVGVFVGFVDEDETEIV